MLGIQDCNPVPVIDYVLPMYLASAEACFIRTYNLYFRLVVWRE